MVKPEPSIGLVIFLVVLAIDIIVLLFDLYLERNGYWTITMYIRNGYPACGIPIILWQLFGVAGLIEHFYW